MFTLGVIPQDTINNDSDDIMIFFIVGFNFTAIYWKVKKKSVKSSMRYTNAPVYIEPQFNPVTGINNYLMSSSVDVQYSTSLTPKRTIGYPVDFDRQYPVSGPSETKINVSFYLHKDTPSNPIPSDLLGFANSRNRMYFDGVDDYVSGLNVSATAGRVSMKCIMTAPQQQFTFLAGIRTITNSDEMLLDFRDSGGLNLYLSVNGLNVNLGALSVGVEHEIEIAWGGSTTEVYIDGLLVVTRNRVVTSGGGFGIGDKNGSSSGWSFNGLIYDVKHYSDKAGTTLVNQYNGYGNTDSDWEDQVGSSDGTVNGSPALFTGQGFSSVNSDDAYCFLYDSIPNLTSGDLGSQTGNADFVIRVGGNTFKKCYLDQYQIQVNPFQPIQASAEFTSYDFPSEESISGDSTIQSNIDSAMKGTGIMDGAHCVLSGANQVVSADVLTSFAYTKKYSRTPIYSIGSVNPVRYLIDEVAAEVAIQSTGLNSFIDYSGKKLTSSISLIPKDVNGNHIDAFGGGQLSFALSSGATLYQEKYSVQEGNSSATSVSIQEIIV